MQPLSQKKKIVLTLGTLWALVAVALVGTGGISGLRSDIMGTSDYICSAETQETNTTQYNNSSARITELRNELASLSDELQTWKTELAGISKEITTATNELKKVRKDSRQLESYVKKSCTTSGSTPSASLPENCTEKRAELEKVEQTIKSLQENIVGLKSKSREINKNMQREKAIKKEIAGLSTFLDDYIACQNSLSGTINDGGVAVEPLPSVVLNIAPSLPAPVTVTESQSEIAQTKEDKKTATGPTAMTDEELSKSVLGELSVLSQEITNEMNAHRGKIRYGKHTYFFSKIESTIAPIERKQVEATNYLLSLQTDIDKYTILVRQKDGELRWEKVALKNLLADYDNQINRAELERSRATNADAKKRLTDRIQGLRERRAEASKVWDKKIQILSNESTALWATLTPLVVTLETKKNERPFGEVRLMSEELYAKVRANYTIEQI